MDLGLFTIFAFSFRINSQVIYFCNFHYSSWLCVFQFIFAQIYLCVRWKTCSCDWNSVHLSGVS